METKLEGVIDKQRLAAFYGELMQKHLRPLISTTCPIEGYVRVAGSSDPALSYKHYEKGATVRSVFTCFSPCLVGTKLTGNDAQVGKVLHTMKKLGARLVDGTWKWEDTGGVLRAIDGSEGDVMIVNTESYFELSGRFTVENVEYDAFLRSFLPFEWHGNRATEVKPFGWSPDYCVMHSDSGTNRMHSVYNPSWNGSYQAPTGVAGKYVFDTDPLTGEITETYDANATLLGGAGGCHSTNIALYDGEQYAMNQNPDTTKPYPYYNHTARGAEILWANLAAEGGTFDSHKASMMGSGFCANDSASAAADWAESASGAKNGIRLEDKSGTMKYYGFSTNMKAFTGGSSDLYAGQIVNDWRNPWKVMEAYRILCYAIANSIPELTWFTLDGNKYKWRSITGFAGPSQGEATAVVFKQMSTKMTSRFVDPTDKTTSLEGNRLDYLVSVALYHGMTTQVSPSWWTSGMIMTEDENGQYKCYIERDQTKLIKSENGEKAIDQSFNFETAYTLAGTYAKGEGYRKNYSNDAFMLPDTNANKSGAGLHTYVCAYNYFDGNVAGAGKKTVRGFRRGYSARHATLSPLYMYGANAPSSASRNDAFGTCVRVVIEA